MDGESQDFIILKCLPAEEPDPEEPDRRDSLVEEQLRHTQEKLRIKESEVDSGISTVVFKPANISAIKTLNNMRILFRI